MERESGAEAGGKGRGQADSTAGAGANSKDPVKGSKLATCAAVKVGRDSAAIRDRGSYAS